MQSCHREHLRISHVVSQGKAFSVILTEGRPDETGRVMARALAELKVPIKVILDSAVAFALEAFKCAPHRILPMCSCSSTPALLLLNRAVQLRSLNSPRTNAEQGKPCNLKQLQWASSCLLLPLFFLPALHSELLSLHSPSSAHAGLSLLLDPAHTTHLIVAPTY